MFSFTRNISLPVRRELVKARQAMGLRDPGRAFSHLENAHVLGQLSTYWHTRVHWLMLVWAVDQKDFSEQRAQLMRLLGAITKTAIGLLPTGNTGGGNVSAFRPLPLSSDHKAIITRARRSL